MEESTITVKGQIVVPAKLRRRYGLTPGTKVYFIERDKDILLRPITKEYLRRVHGMLTSKTPATKELLAERVKDREREEIKLAKRRPR